MDLFVSNMKGNPMSTPHISAEPDDFAPAVLMPGDPKRAERIANYLFDQPRLVTNVRGMLGFTGTLNGRPLSVMGSGMGQPSMAIYATELYEFYDVQRIIRVGTCGGIASDVHVGDTVIALAAHTDSAANLQRIPSVFYAPTASFGLVEAAYAAAPEPARLHVGTIFSSDSFYRSWPSPMSELGKYGTLGVEMETAVLYTTAAEFGREALTVLTVSDHVINLEPEMSAAARETSFESALKMAVAAAFS